MKKQNWKIMTGALSATLALTLGVGAICLKNRDVAAEAAEPFTYFRSDDTMTVTEDYTGAKGKGVRVVLNTEGKSTAKFEYLNYIRTSDLENFLTMAFEPTKTTDTDFDYVTVTLTDSLDTDNKLVYAVCPQPESSGWWYKYTTSWIALTDDLVPTTEAKYSFAALLQIKGTTQNIVGKNNTVQSANGYYRGPYQDSGYIIGEKTSYFQGAGLNTISFGLEGGVSAKINNQQVASLTDRDWLKLSAENLTETELFDKYTEEYVTSLFSSGYVTMSVQFLNVKSDTVSCYMTKIGDQTFANNEGKVIDSEPYMFADITTNAIQGLSYTLPSCTASSLRDGDLSENVQVSVKNTATDASVSQQNGKVVFPSAGEYSIEYTVTNPRSKAFTKSYTITCFAEMPRTTFSTQTSFADRYMVGETIELPAMKGYSNLSRESDTTVPVIAVVQRDGRVIKTYDDLTDTQQLFLDAEGTYGIVYMHKNEFNQIQSIGQTFTVEAGIMANIQQPPVSFTAGKTNTLLDFDVVSYINGVSSENAYRAIYIGDKQVYLAKGASVISGSLTLPADTFTAKGNAQLIYKTGASESTLAVVKTLNIPVIKPYYISDYIAPLNGDGNYDESGLTVTNTLENVSFVTEKDKTFLLPQALPSDNLSISFGGSKEYSAYQSLRITLKNILNDKKIIVDVSKQNTAASTVTVNGKSYSVSGSLINDANYFEWVWSDTDKAFLDMDGETLFNAITTYSDGSAFNGFNGAPVSLSFTINGVEEGEQGGFRLIKVLNQMFGSTLIGATVQPHQDMVAPVIWYENALVNQKVNIATELRIPKAVAYDVLDNYTTLNVSVVNPDGSEIISSATCDIERSVIFDTFGGYKVIFTTSDSNTLFVAQTTFDYTVMDLDAPIITMDGDVAQTAKVGVAVTMPKAYVFDNVTQDCQYYVIVYTPHGERQVVDGSYTFGYAGIYKVVYYCYDANYNVSEKVFTVNVQ